MTIRLHPHHQWTQYNYGHIQYGLECISTTAAKADYYRLHINTHSTTMTTQRLQHFMLTIIYTTLYSTIDATIAYPMTTIVRHDQHRPLQPRLHPILPRLHN